jgi:hypothetical protein
MTSDLLVRVQVRRFVTLASALRKALLAIAFAGLF